LRKLALKKLKLSDLSFFKSHFAAHASSKQKGFNLDTNVLEGQFYPGLKEALTPRPKKSTHVDLTVLGPGLAPAYTLARKIKIDAKNLRLNGELIHDPDDQAGRFSKLKEDDFVLLEFGGAQLPETIRIVLIASAELEDSALHVGCMKLLPKKTDSMCVITEEDLQTIIRVALPAASHPVMDWLEPELIEGVATGDPQAIAEVTKRRAGRGMSAADLKDAKAAAAQTGENGEELLNAFFSARKDPKIREHQWVSQENAISPYDFLLSFVDGKTHHVDAKSTAAKFETPLYLSTGEIRHALASEIPYDIYRLYGVTEIGADMRIARDIKKRLGALQCIFDTLPKGVRIDSLAIDPNFLDFDSGVIRIDDDSTTT
jgi:hypothetical protein